MADLPDPPAIWNAVDGDGNTVAVSVLTPRYCAAFTVEHGDLLETVDRTVDGAWDWTAASVCDPRRGDSPEVQDLMRSLLWRLSQDALR